MPGQDVQIPGVDGSFGGYLARPAQGSGPGLIVLQEIFGVSPAMRAITDAFAEAGFIALCPDLFWRLEPGVSLDGDDPEAFETALSFYKRFDVDLGLQDIKSAGDYLAALPECTGRIGASGYCLGGYLAYLSACRLGFDAAVGYYAVGLEKVLDDAAGLRGHCMLHVAEQDGFVPPKIQHRIAEALSGLPGFVLHAYPDQDHAFARVGGHAYDAEAAALANRRSLDFLHAHLS